MKPGLKSDRVTVRDIGIVTRHGTRLTQPLVKGGAVLYANLSASFRLSFT